MDNKHHKIQETQEQSVNKNKSSDDECLSVLDYLTQKMTVVMSLTKTISLLGCHLQIRKRSLMASKTAMALISRRQVP